MPLEELLLRIYAAGTYCGGLKGGAREMVRVCLGFPVIGSELPCDIGGAKEPAILCIFLLNEEIKNPSIVKITG